MSHAGRIVRWWGLLFLVGLPAVGALAVDSSPGADEWKYDVVYRKRGKPMSGLVVEEGKEYVILKCISRKPGAPTIVFNEYLPVAEVERVELLGPDDRNMLRRRLQGLVRERELLSAHLKHLDPGSRLDQVSGDTVHLRPVAWVKEGKSKAQEYESNFFTLVSNAREEVIQLTAIQLEQVYAAYARCLPPRRQGPNMGTLRTQIVLTGNLADYQELVRDQGLNFFNPAFYDVARNRVVCGSDLQRLSDRREQIRHLHQEKLAEIEETRTSLNQTFRGKIPPEILGSLVEAQKSIKKTEEENNQKFNRARGRLFQRLYHEAFHAYLASFVYPPSEGEVPRWLNEGLAQIFESAIFEVGELRVGHADPERLTAVRLAISGKGKWPMLPLVELLRSDENQFQVKATHAADADRQVSDRFYLASWALAMHLTFDRKVLGTKEMDAYIRALKRGEDPLTAFRDLVKQPLPEFEKSYLRYLSLLRPDGSVGK